jgi:hypothetical protein
MEDAGGDAIDLRVLLFSPRTGCAHAEEAEKSGDISGSSPLPLLLCVPALFRIRYRIRKEH